MADHDERVDLGEIFPKSWRRAPEPPHPAEAEGVGGEKRPEVVPPKVKMGFERHRGVVAVAYYYRGVPVDVTLCFGDEEGEQMRQFYLDGHRGDPLHVVDVVPVQLPAKVRTKELVVLVKASQGLPDGCAVCWNDEETEAHRELLGESYQGWGDEETDVVVTRFVVEYPKHAVQRMGFEREWRENFKGRERQIDEDLDSRE